MTDEYCFQCNRLSVQSSNVCCDTSSEILDPLLEEEIAAFERLSIAGLAFTEEEIEADIKRAIDEHRRTELLKYYYCNRCDYSWTSEQPSYCPYCGFGPTHERFDEEDTDDE